MRPGVSGHFVRPATFRHERYSARMDVDGSDIQSPALGRACRTRKGWLTRSQDITWRFVQRTSLMDRPAHWRFRLAGIRPMGPPWACTEHCHPLQFSVQHTHTGQFEACHGSLDLHTTHRSCIRATATWAPLHAGRPHPRRHGRRRHRSLFYGTPCIYPHGQLSFQRPTCVCLPSSRECHDDVHGHVHVACGGRPRDTRSQV